MLLAYLQAALGFSKTLFEKIHISLVRKAAGNFALTKYDSFALVQKGRRKMAYFHFCTVVVIIDLHALLLW